MKQFEFICGGSETTTEAVDGRRFELDVQGSGTVNLRVGDIARSMVGNIPDVLLDLLEVAAYVYCADQRATRGSDSLAQAGSLWRRAMRFVIPVRDPEFWSAAELREELASTLGYLSDDLYEFEFVKAAAPAAQPALYFPDLSEGGFDPDEVALFSGGIDSFAGAVEAIVARGRKMVLVGHHSASKVFAVQKELVAELRQAGFGQQLFHIPVNVTNRGIEPVETTQRSRSFLFATLGFVIAQMFGKDRFTFYENGIVSLNLSIANDVLGARATRTTHPRVIRGFERIFSILADRQVEMSTPFLWLTKKEVIECIMASGMGRLLSRTVSCVHPILWTREVRHCGQCSQCIDRRFGILAADAAAHDPSDGYATDLLTGPRDADEDVRVAVAYIKFARSIDATSRDRFPLDHPEIFDAVRHVPGLPPDAVLDHAWDLHRRHADAVNGVIETGIQDHSRSLTRDSLPRGALLRLCFSRHQIEAPPSSDPLDQVQSFLDRLPAPVCDFAIDQADMKIWFRGGFFLEGVDYELVAMLLKNHREAKARCEDVPLFHTSELALALRIEEPALRKRIIRCRAMTERRLAVDQGIVLPDGFIENVYGKGYRIAPQLREVSLADLGNATAEVTNGKA